METKREKAEKFFKEGYNCAQAVVLAYAEDFNLDESMASKIASGFGAGMGRMREVCGAISGACIVAGLKYGDFQPHDNKSKQENYDIIQKVADEFKELNGSIICKELLGIDGKDTSPKPSERTKEYYKKRPCVEMVGIASEIVEKYINK